MFFAEGDQSSTRAHLDGKLNTRGTIRLARITGCRPPSAPRDLTEAEKIGAIDRAGPIFRHCHRFNMIQPDDPCGPKARTAISEAELAAPILSPAPQRPVRGDEATMVVMGDGDGASMLEELDVPDVEAAPIAVVEKAEPQVPPAVGCAVRDGTVESRSDVHVCD